MRDVVKQRGFLFFKRYWVNGKSFKKERDAINSANFSYALDSIKHIKLVGKHELSGYAIYYYCENESDLNLLIQFMMTKGFVVSTTSGDEYCLFPNWYRTSTYQNNCFIQSLPEIKQNLLDIENKLNKELFKKS